MKKKVRGQGMLSNTAVGSGHNVWLQKAGRFRVRSVFRPTVSGAYPWRLWFTNSVHTSFGEHKWAGASAQWSIIEGQLGFGDNLDALTFVPLTFQGKRGSAVGESLWTDTVLLPACSCLVVDLTVEGDSFPCTPDSQISCWVEERDGSFSFQPYVPKPCLLEAEREVDGSLLFLGDSITQGRKTVCDRYDFWVAHVARALPRWAVWNLGLSFATAEDGAQSTAWTDLAKGADRVVVSLGLNDVIQGHSATAILQNLQRIRTRFPNALFTTLAPFSLPPEQEAVRCAVNQGLQTWGSVFDLSACCEQSPGVPKFGDHPVGAGGQTIAGAFLDQERSFFH